MELRTFLLVAAAIAVVVFAGANFLSPSDERLIPVIISTDTSTGLNGGWRAGISDIDDGLAVAMALASDVLDVRGVVVTWGNNDLAPEVAVARRVVGLTGERVPVVGGTAVSLTDPQVAWFDGTPLNDACLNDGVRFMADELNKGAPIKLLAIGPLTDVACVVLNFPEVVGNIAEVVAIMGRDPDQSFAINGHTGLTDFNYVMDPRAAQIVLDAEVPVTFITFSTTSSALVPRSQLSQLLDDSSLNAFFLGAATPWVDFWHSTFGEDGFHPWDQNAIYYAMNPSAYACTDAGVQVVGCGSGPYFKDQNNPCAGHGPDQPTSLDKEASQLWLSPDATPRQVNACRSYADDAAKQAFLGAIFNFAN